MLHARTYLVGLCLDYLLLGFLWERILHPKEEYQCTEQS